MTVNDIFKTNAHKLNKEVVKIPVYKLQITNLLHFARNTENGKQSYRMQNDFTLISTATKELCEYDAISMSAKFLLRAKLYGNHSAYWVNASFVQRAVINKLPAFQKEMDPDEFVATMMHKQQGLETVVMPKLSKVISSKGPFYVIGQIVCNTYTKHNGDKAVGKELRVYDVDFNVDEEEEGSGGPQSNALLCNGGEYHYYNEQ